MKFVIAGGCSSVGVLVTKHLQKSAHEIVLLKRTGRSRIGRAVKWDGKSLGDWVTELDGADVLMNVGPSPDERIKHLSVEDSTRILLKAVLQCKRPPQLWLNINVSTPTIHAHTLDTPGTRRISLRSGFVVEAEPGVTFDSAFLGVGDSAGANNEWTSWIHEKDYVGIIDFLVERTDISGVVNVCAPTPVSQQDFMNTLRGKAGISYSVSLPTLLGRLSTFLNRSDMPKKQQVVPTRLLSAGYEFLHPHWESAVEEVIQVWETRGYPQGWFQKMFLRAGEILNACCGDTMVACACLK